MDFTPTKEQLAIINADLVPQCVIACAGSGKTTTAVRRMFEIRRRLGHARGYVALLSYSNVAVENFRSEYAALSSQVRDLSPRVLIATVDAFITSHIVLPHAAREMGCTSQPFLVRGPNHDGRDEQARNGGVSQMDLIRKSHIDFARLTPMQRLHGCSCPEFPDN